MALSELTYSVEKNKIKTIMFVQLAVDMIYKVQSHLLSFGELLQTKSNNFNWNWVKRVCCIDFAVQTSNLVQLVI